MTPVTTDNDLARVLEQVAALARTHPADGDVADYIPSIASLDPNTFGLAVVETDGTEHVTGDVDVQFPTQSISKVFSLVLAMRRTDAESGTDAELWQRCGVEPSGDPFNSLVQLEELAGESIGVDETVLAQEGNSGQRNAAMANLMSSFGNLRHTVAEVQVVYVHQCAIAMTTRQLARAVRFLGNDGIDPASGRTVLRPEHARRVSAIMLTCGAYDSVGEFAFDIGFPCKSGVAGAIVGMVNDVGVKRSRVVSRLVAAGARPGNPFRCSETDEQAPDLETGTLVPVVR